MPYSVGPASSPRSTRPPCRSASRPEQRPVLDAGHHTQRNARGLPGGLGLHAGGLPDDGPLRLTRPVQRVREMDAARAATTSFPHVMLRTRAGGRLDMDIGRNPRQSAVGWMSV